MGSQSGFDNHRQVKLYYFNVFAKGPAIALALSHGNLDWEGIFPTAWKELQGAPVGRDLGGYCRGKQKLVSGKGRIGRPVFVCWLVCWFAGFIWLVGWLVGWLVVLLVWFIDGFVWFG